MTTDRELRDLLIDEAEAPPCHTAPWDDIVRRGRYHRRVARVRSGLLAGGVAALAVVGLIAATDLGDEERTGVIANDPDVTGTTIDRPPLVPNAIDLQAVRAGAAPELTVPIEPSDPPSGYDPCTATGPLVEQGDQIRLSVVPTAQANAAWLTCRPGPFSSFATVALDKPVHTRPVIDGSDGKEVLVVDQADLLFPTSLPEGFDPEDHDEFAQATYEGEPVEGWTFSWIVDDVVINVGRWSLAGEHPDGCAPEGPITVRGLPGFACRPDGIDIVTNLRWTEGTSVYVLEVSDVGGDRLRTDIDLVAIAEGLEPLG